MNTNQLKRFAKEARIKLLDQVGRKLEFVLTHDTSELRGKEKEIIRLKQKVLQIGKEQVIEMVAYTWFNRLMALRFMDANGYTVPKVVTPLPGMTNPEILQNVLGGNIEPELNLDRKRLNELLDGKTAVVDTHTETYKMLLIASCNQWHTAMPFMFEPISDYTELLLPDDLLSDYSIVADIRNGMSEEDCQQEELIGWLYQFYISDKKDQVFEGLRHNIKITSENIPAATQLFTPHWIVRYMVENTLGKLWLTFKPNSKIRQHMPYYIEAPEGNVPSPLPEGIKGVTDITFLDPCQGSGHVLVYAFELFTKIYEEEGYNTNEIPALILDHNLFGIDIDERAAQLAAFALTMKALSYYPRFLRKSMQPHVIALKNVIEDIIKQAVKLPLAVAGKLVYDYKDLSIYNLTQADNFGSLVQIDPEELKALHIQKGSIWQEQEQQLKEKAEYLSRQYNCVVTNPPYLSSVGMNKNLKIFTESRYPKTRTDLMACFMERCISFTNMAGEIGMINQHSWMFLSSYVELRLKIIVNIQFETLLHLGPKTFPEIGGEVVQNAAFTFGNYTPINKGNFIRLIEFTNPELKELKTKEAIENKKSGWRYESNQKDFELITGSPIAYWASPHVLSLYKNPTIGSIAFARKGNTTTNNDKYVKQWQELNFKNIAIDYSSIYEANNNNKYWIPYNKGGGYRRWFGLNSTVVFWKNNGSEIKSLPKSVVANEQFYMREGTTWGHISSHSFSGRYFGKGFIFDNAGNCLFSDEKEVLALNAFLNSNTFQKLSEYTNPTIGFSSGEVAKIPYKMNEEYRFKVESITKNNIDISKSDWLARETSWDFQQNELIKLQKNNLKLAIKAFTEYWTGKFHELHHNEEELNWQFIEIYGLQDELSPDVPLKEITVLQEEGKIVDNQLVIQAVPVLMQLLSYSIGCMFGRYSLDKPGLILANQGETLQDYLRIVDSCSLSVVSEEAPTTNNYQLPTKHYQPTTKFMPDEDNIIPILDGEWFADDIVGRFKVFLKTAFGEEHFEENLKFIEDTIGKDIRKYFVKDFYNDHIKRYKKRPIYWMFSSPKGHFKALIYMHRYQPDLCSKLLNDYLLAFISKLEAKRQSETRLSLREDISSREKTLAIKEIDKSEAMLKDCREYFKTLFAIATQKISIDLDDGVKVNYQKFKDILVPIKGLEKEEE